MVELSYAPPMARFSLRARTPQALETVLGIKLPHRIGECNAGAICLGPDEWLLRAPEGRGLPSAEGLPLSIVDVSDRAVCIIVEGERAIDVLQSGCPRDLSKLAVGQARRTVFEGVEIILIRESETRFAVDVWRSFSPWLWLALETVVGHLR